MTTMVRKLQEYILPSIPRRGMGVSLFLLLCLACACSSDDDNTSDYYTFTKAVQPEWSVDLKGNVDAPSWVSPDPSKFESSMFILVKLQDELVPFSTDNDLMTVFINNECRAVPSVRNVDKDGNIYFVLKIRGNSNDRDVLFSLSYYCAQLRQLFTLEGKETFATEVTYGYDEDFVPPLIRGCSTYPKTTELTVNLSPNEPFTPAAGDRIAAFVGNDCRGVGTVGEPFIVFRKNVNETITLKYYSTQMSGIYTRVQTLTPASSEERAITLTF